MTHPHNDKPRETALCRAEGIVIRALETDLANPYDCQPDWYKMTLIISALADNYGVTAATLIKHYKQEAEMNHECSQLRKALFTAMSTGR